MQGRGCHSRKGEEVGTARLCVSLQGRPSGPPCVPSRGFQAVPEGTGLRDLLGLLLFSDAK